MKCAGALAAMTVIVLGTPAIALAGTIAPGSGPGHPGQVRIVCPPPPHGKPVRLRLRLQYARRHGKGARLRLACAFPRGCPPQPLTFDVASGGSTLTEVRGPVLAPPEEFWYDGQIYTIMSVNPGADSFTVFRDNALFVNEGPAITGATGLMLCTTARSVKTLT